MIYPAVSQYWNYKTQSRIIENYQDVMSSSDTNLLDNMFQTAKRKLNKAVVAVPTCKLPLGEGAILTLISSIFSLGEIFEPYFSLFTYCQQLIKYIYNKFY